MSRARLPLVVMIVVALLGSVFARRATGPARADAAATRPADADKQLAAMSSYSLGLLLGGLRGPLVMALWSSSENQKSERRLEDFDTKVELIRMLQPEFDSVHIFQVWNKAYNISVQMANLPSKYATIIDALEYAANVAAEKPGNINIIVSVGGIYFDKLGNSAEKLYYRERLRDETSAPREYVRITFPPERRGEFIEAARQAGADSRRYTIRPAADGSSLLASLRADYADRLLPLFTGGDVRLTRVPARVADRNDPGWTPDTHALLLDAQGNLLPGLADTSRPVPIEDYEYRGDLPPLQYLAPFAPFKQGVSPFALAYQHYRNAVALQTSRGVFHSQLSDRVISSRPAMSLKFWAEEDFDRGRRAEFAALGVALPADTLAPALESPTASAALDAPAVRSLLDEAIENYDEAARIFDVAHVEFELHAERFPEDRAGYADEQAALRLFADFARADAGFLRLLRDGPASAEAARAAEADAFYARAADASLRLLVGWFISEEVASEILPEGSTRFDAESKLTTEQLREAVAKLEPLVRQRGLDLNISTDEFVELTTYVARCDARRATLRPLLPAGR